MRTVSSPAKINWSLRITGRRPDGFHDLETVFQSISLQDELTFRDADRFSLTCDDPAIPTDDSNLILRAAQAIGAPAMWIGLKKRIPAGGGLGGGSSNAAAVLRTFGAGRPDLPALALSLGSDVPFFLLGGTAYATGRGEVLTPMPAMRGIPLLLLLPEARVLTRDAFARVEHYSAPLGLEAYRDFSSFTNDFEEPVFSMLPALGTLKQQLYEAGASWAGMSGSGSTIVGAFNDAATRDRAATAFSAVRVEKAETT